VLQARERRAQQAHKATTALLEQPVLKEADPREPPDRWEQQARAEV